MKKKRGWSGWNIFENNPFIEGFAQWMDSSDGKRLSIDQSVQRIHADYPEFPLDLIEYKIIAWLEMGFAPESYSQEQLHELDRLTEQWIDDHNGGRKRW